MWFEVELALVAGEVHQTDPIRLDHRQLAVVEKEQVTRVRQQSGDVGRDETLAVDTPDHCGGTLPPGHDFVRVIGRDHGQGEHPAQLFQGFEHGRFKVPVEVLLNQVRDDLGIGIRCELVTLRAERSFDGKVVLDDAVVDDHDSPLAVAVRVGVLFGRATVCGPAGVSESVSSTQRLLGEKRLQIRQLPGTTTELHFPVVDHRDAGRIVASILKAAEPAEDERHSVAITDVSEYAAHG